jgi:hypothetical protein
MGETGSAGLVPPRIFTAGSTALSDSLEHGYSLDPWLSKRCNRRKVALRNGIYYYKNGCLYIPDFGGEEDVLAHRKDNLRTQLIMEHHKSLVAGHCGVTKTLELLCRQYWWPGIREQVQDLSVIATRANGLRRQIIKLGGCCNHCKCHIINGNRLAWIL